MKNLPSLLAQLPWPYEHPKPEPERDYDSGAEIIRVSRNELPEGVLGMYIHSSHAIYLRDDLPENIKQFVKAHESGHALGIRNEYQTDQYAASKVGYHLRILSPQHIYN